MTICPTKHGPFWTSRQGRRRPRCRSGYTLNCMETWLLVFRKGYPFSSTPRPLPLWRYIALVGLAVEFAVPRAPRTGCGLRAAQRASKHLIHAFTLIVTIGGAKWIPLFSVQYTRDDSMNERHGQNWKDFEDWIHLLDAERNRILERAKRTHVSKLLFRGQSDSSWSLQTTLERQPGASFDAGDITG